jgi:hypothetical protein
MKPRWTSEASIDRRQRFDLDSSGYLQLVGSSFVGRPGMEARERRTRDRRTRERRTRDRHLAGASMNVPPGPASNPSTDAEIVGLEPGVRVNGPTIAPADETMTDVLAHYAEASFAGDAFASTGGQISCGTCSSCLSPANVAIEGMRRIEGASDPSDMAAVLAIICPVCQTKATLVLKFGPEASVDEIAIWHVLKVQTEKITASNLVALDQSC